MIARISRKRCQWLAWRVWWYVTDLRYRRDYLAPGICSLIKSAAMKKKWCHFPPKIHRGCTGVVCEAPGGSNDAVINRAKRGFWRNHFPWARRYFTNNAQSAQSLFPLWHETHKFATFPLKIGPQSSRWTWRHGQLVNRNPLSIVTPSILI